MPIITWDDEDENDPDCTCVPHMAHATDISPPEGRKRDPWCPVHGRDPDEAYEEYRDRRSHEAEDRYDDSRDYE